MGSSLVLLYQRIHCQSRINSLSTEDQSTIIPLSFHSTPVLSRVFYVLERCRIAAATAKLPEKNQRGATLCNSDIRPHDTRPHDTRPHDTATPEPPHHHNQIRQQTKPRSSRDIRLPSPKWSDAESPLRGSQCLPTKTGALSSCRNRPPTLQTTWHGPLAPATTAHSQTSYP